LEERDKFRRETSREGKGKKKVGHSSFPILRENAESRSTTKQDSTLCGARGLGWKRTNKGTLKKKTRPSLLSNQHGGEEGQYILEPRGGRKTVRRGLGMRKKEERQEENIDSSVECIKESPASYKVRCDRSGTWRGGHGGEEGAGLEREERIFSQRL